MADEGSKQTEGFDCKMLSMTWTGLSQTTDLMQMAARHSCCPGSGLGFRSGSGSGFSRVPDKAMMRRSTYKGGKQIEADPKLDWAGNLAHMMGAALTHHVVMCQIRQYNVPCPVKAVAN